MTFLSYEPVYLDKEKSKENIPSGPIGGAKGGVIGGVIDSQKKPTGRQREILELIIEDNKISFKAIANKFNINESAVIKHIGILKSKGAIVRIGGTRGYWKVIGK